MEISDFNVGLGAARQGVDWGWLQSRVRSSRCGHPAEQVQNRLTELLFGTRLSQREKLEYRVKLAEALDVIDDLDQAVTPARVVRAWRIGSGSFTAMQACSAMLRRRVTSGSQVA